MSHAWSHDIIIMYLEKASAVLILSLCIKSNLAGGGEIHYFNPTDFQVCTLYRYSQNTHVQKSFLKTVDLTLYVRSYSWVTIYNTSTMIRDGNIFKQ